MNANTSLARAVYQDRGLKMPVLPGATKGFAEDTHGKPETMIVVEFDSGTHWIPATVIPALFKALDDRRSHAA